MFARRTPQVTVSVEVKEGDRVVKTFSFDMEGSDALTFDVSIDNKLPDRSPLHAKALNLDDLKIGLNIEHFNIYGRGGPHRTGIITGQACKRDVGWTQRDVWMVPVVTTNYRGKLVQEEWFLNDMGVTPYTAPDGTRSWWNDQNYTLAAD